MKITTLYIAKTQILLLFSVLFLQSCSNDNTEPLQTVEPPVTVSTEKTMVVEKPPMLTDTTTPAAPEMALEQGNTAGQVNHINLNNTQYLYIVNEHSVDELENLLKRADEIATNSSDSFNDLEVAMVIHGPSVNLFKQSNYDNNKNLVDLAAKLDAYNVIDIKICEASMSQFEVNRTEVPDFIESVPFAPDEIKRLDQEGYINL